MLPPPKVKPLLSTWKLPLAQSSVITYTGPNPSMLTWVWLAQAERTGLARYRLSNKNIIGLISGICTELCCSTMYARTHGYLCLLSTFISHFNKQNKFGWAEPHSKFTKGSFNNTKTNLGPKNSGSKLFCSRNTSMLLKMLCPKIMLVAKIWGGVGG